MIGGQTVTRSPRRRARQTRSPLQDARAAVAARGGRPPIPLPPARASCSGDRVCRARRRGDRVTV